MNFLLLLILVRDINLVGLRLLTLFFIVVLFILPLITLKIKKFFLAQVGYLWMGFVIYFLLCFFCLKAVSIIWSKDVSHDLLVQSSFFLGLVITAYSYSNISKIKIKKFLINITDKSTTNEEIKIIHLSDIHWGFFVGEKEMMRISRLVDTLQPDILILSGDVIDAQGEIDSKFEKCLTMLSAKKIKIMVFGNHEEYFNKEKLVLVFEKNGFKVLLDEFYDEHKLVQIYGVESNSNMDLEKLANCVRNDKFKILVSHKAFNNIKISELFDLQLSGHTHAGQFFPLNVLTWLLFKYHYGLYKIKHDKMIYVSSGTGTWLPPLRLFTRPEIVLFTLKFRGV